MKARLMSSGAARILCGSFLLASALAIVGGSQGISSSAGATGSVLELSVPSVDFGGVTLGDGALETVTVTNTDQNTAVQVPLPEATGADPLDFYAVPNIGGLDPDVAACQSVDPFNENSEYFTVSLSPNQSCTYFLVFAPGGLGDKSATIPFGDNVDSGASLPVSGNGTIGYYQVGSTGKVANFGDAQSFGDPSGIPLNSPIVGMAQTGDNGGYWLVASDGGIFNYGDAQFLRIGRGHPPEQAHRRHGQHRRR